MPTPEETLAAIDAAIASPNKQVQHRGKTVIRHDPDQLLRARSSVVRRNRATPRSNATVVSVERV